MAFELSRIDRLTKTYPLAVRFPELDGPFTAADVALLPPRVGPNASTVWYTASVASGIATVLFAGPDADPTGAVVVSGAADLWMRVNDSPEVDAVKIERIVVLGGGTVPAVPLDRGLPTGGTTGQVLSKASGTAYDAEWTAPSGTPIGGAGGALSGSYPNPGLNVAAVDTSTAANVNDSGSNTAIALRAAYGRAAPVLSNFNYDAATGNLLSYQEDGIAITLTYNADGTVATSKRGSDPVQTFTYSGGNLVGVA